MWGSRRDGRRGESEGEAWSEGEPGWSWVGERTKGEGQVASKAPLNGP